MIKMRAAAHFRAGDNPDSEAAPCLHRANSEMFEK